MLRSQHHRDFSHTVVGNPLSTAITFVTMLAVIAIAISVPAGAGASPVPTAKCHHGSQVSVHGNIAPDPIAPMAFDHTAKHLSRRIMRPRPSVLQQPRLVAYVRIGPGALSLLPVHIPSAQSSLSLPLLV